MPMLSASADTSWCALETPFGLCHLGWSARGISRFHLPEGVGEGAEGNTGAQSDTSVPAFVGIALSQLRRYFAGEAVTFAPVVLDLDGVPAFHRALYAALCRVAWGETATYGSLAAAVGEPGAARAVGRAMGANPIPVIIPCHRVLAAGGRMGGFSAPGGTTTKQRLLELEGVHPIETRQMGFGF